jgi:hypothetical protein
MAAQLAASLGARVSGIDAAEPLLVIARARVPHGDFRLGDLEELPFAERSFDLVTGFNSMQYAGNPTAAVTRSWTCSQIGRHRRDRYVGGSGFDGLRVSGRRVAAVLASACARSFGTVRVVR